MAVNYRRPLLKQQSENPTVLIGKTHNAKETGITTKRPALIDVQNKITNRDVANKTFPKKKPDVTSKPTQKSSVLTVKDTKKVNIAQPKPDTKKAITTKFESECKIEEIESKSFSSKRYEGLEEEVVGNDPHFVPEYVHDIFDYLKSLEDKFTIDPLFMVGHKSTPRMRLILINWLVEVQMNFKLLPETLHLCVSIIDRYLQKNKMIGRETLQLVGVTAMWIAGKYEEMYIPDTSDYAYLCENNYSVKQIIQMEVSIVQTLDFSFGRPLSLHFLRRYSRVNNVQPREHTLAKYFLELALIEIDLCHVKPSLQAAAAMYLSLRVLNQEYDPTWSKTLVHYSGYSFEDIKKIVKLMAEAVVKAETSKYQAIRSKYAATNNMKISLCAELKGPVIKRYVKAQLSKDTPRNN